MTLCAMAALRRKAKFEVATACLCHKQSTELSVGISNAFPGGSKSDYGASAGIHDQRRSVLWLKGDELK